MPKIHVLDEHLTNMIAAGEVVERPANIVKECMENSLDAGATSISVEVREGGISGITITDDGCGMDPQDARLAFCRHATSKLMSEDDLFNIGTMGFRGEALPSIASVAEVVIRTDNGETGTRLHYAYGELTESETGRFPAGTMIEVTGLFVRTPARFKYLKRPAYEFSIIADIVNKIALSHPDVRITLTHDGRTVFSASGSGSRQEILYQMYGREVAAAAVAVDEKSDDFHITGYVVQPKISRASRHYMFLSVNGRIIRSKQLQDALIDAYADFMPPGRYPIAILDVEVDTQLVDVNVHPNKWEVKIAKQPELAQLIRDSVRRVFDIQLRTVEIKPENIERPVPNAFEREAMAMERRELSERSYEKPENSRFEDQIPRKFRDPQPDPQLSLFEGAADEAPAQPTFAVRESPEPTVQTPFPGTGQPAQGEDQVRETAAGQPLEYPVPVTPKYQEEVSPQAQGKAFFHALRVIGQLRDSYILCEGPQGLVVIDQHAAQERYHYEQLQEKLLKPDGKTQPLMIPILLKAGPRILANLAQIDEMTAAFGIRFEAFGTDQVIVRELPVWMASTDEQGFLQDLLDQFDTRQQTDIAALRKHVIATMACHSSIRFNRPLSLPEMERVIEDLQKCRQPYHCPHGRPTVITLSDDRLRKEFERG